MADGLLVVDAAGRVQVYTLPAEEMLGLPAGGLAVGVSLADLAPLPGLLAAGEVVGGLHGAAYMTGSALGKALIFGRVAARTALTG